MVGGTDRKSAAKVHFNDVLVSPPLIVTAAEIDRGLAILADCLEILQDKIQGSARPVQEDFVR